MVGFFSVYVAGASNLELVEGVRLCVFFVVMVSGDRFPAVWNFPLVIPTTCHSPFSFSSTAQEVGIVISGNRGCEMDPTKDFTATDLLAGIPK